MAMKASIRVKHCFQNKFKKAKEILKIMWNGTYFETS